eukprot:TRINITY_DN15978_c0_g1_i1.p1 TRINITY_DN15978_c0_g1~~TRINITY_DN15978_c0_g1_i1.p1  ORF type:complete len:180 (+),score=28.89 TRINITY_DN15978_c0_g1_i1:46-540(+)
MMMTMEEREKTEPSQVFTSECASSVKCRSRWMFFVIRIRVLQDDITKKVATSTTMVALVQSAVERFLGKMATPSCDLLQYDQTLLRGVFRVQREFAPSFWGAITLFHYPTSFSSSKLDNDSKSETQGSATSLLSSLPPCRLEIDSCSPFISSLSKQQLRFPSLS